jgi:hypothetical protein
MKRRRPQSPEERFSEEAKRLRAEAKLLPPGVVRDEMIRRARKAEIASQLNKWITSPGLRPPD